MLTNEILLFRLKEIKKKNLRINPLMNLESKWNRLNRAPQKISGNNNLRDVLLCNSLMIRELCERSQRPPASRAVEGKIIDTGARRKIYPRPRATSPRTVRVWLALVCTRACARMQYASSNASRCEISSFPLLLLRLHLLFFLFLIFFSLYFSLSLSLSFSRDENGFSVTFQERFCHYVFSCYLAIFLFLSRHV